MILKFLSIYHKGFLILKLDWNTIAKFLFLTIIPWNFSLRNFDENCLQYNYTLNPIGIFNAIKYMYTYYPDPNNRSHIREEFVNFWSDYFFVAPQVRQKHAISEFTGLWLKTGLWTRICIPPDPGFFCQQIQNFPSRIRFTIRAFASIQCVTFQSQSRQSAMLFLQSSELEPPAPPLSPAGDCVLLPFGSWGWHTRLRERRWGVPVRTRGQTLW